VGFAERVCAGPTAPVDCPKDAIVYAPFWVDVWGTDLSAIPGATWIWAPGITGESSPSRLVSYFFSKAFILPGRPVSGRILVDADDFAAVFVNDRFVGQWGSVDTPGTDPPRLVTFDLKPFLKPGKNVVTVEGENGPFGGCDDPCSYADNPAGVVFGGSLTFRR
jgi:hypothetical protein